ncbi:hypothetical protein ACIKP7_05410 [Pseudomonas caricapapayae]|jgi:chromosome segregation ATPase|uniref:Uncharacterized protein n=1 Tax=Pseudomonas caricapapayae TaxID=46678 RepID=A0ACC7LRR2_9PSED
MSAQELILANNKTPVHVATDFLGVIKDIERCIEDSNAQVATIQNRGLFKSAFSSSRKDLLGISQSQNKINEMMLGLIQEVITLNTMSYSFLAAVISEVEQRGREGWRDNEGNIQQLSETGRQFADRANDIFVKILDGSKSTQNKIEVNQKNLLELRESLDLKAVMVQKNTAEISVIKASLSDKAVQMQENLQAINSIQSLLKEKSERLGNLDRVLEQKKQTLEHHDQAIHSLIAELQENNRLDIQREQTIESIQARLDRMEQQSSDALGTLHSGLASAVQHLAGLDTALEGKQQSLDAIDQTLQTLHQQLTQQDREQTRKFDALTTVIQENITLSGVHDQRLAGSDQALQALTRELHTLEQQLTTHREITARSAARSNVAIACLAGGLLVVAGVAAYALFALLQNAS